MKYPHKKEEAVMVNEKKMVTRPESMSDKSEKERQIPVVEVVESDSMTADEPVKQTTGIAPVVIAKKTVIETEAKPTKIKWGLFYAGLLFLVFVAGAAGGLWWGYQTKWGLPEPTPTPVAVETPMATPEPIVVELNRSAITVDVYNGSGKTGLASEVAQKIKDLGYQIGKVGNAVLQQSNTIQLSDDVASLSAEISADMQETAGTVTVGTESLAGEMKVSLILGEE